MRRIDFVDTEILRIIQCDGRIASSEIARRVGLVASATAERLRKLERDGILLGVEGRIAPRALSLDLLAFVFVRADEPPGGGSTATELAAIPGVQEVHHVAGEDCYLVKLRTATPASLGTLLRERFGAISTIRSTRTTIVLDTVHESGRLPIPEADEGA